MCDFFILKNMKIYKNIINIYCKIWEINFLKSNFDYINNVLKKLIKNGKDKFKISCEIKN